MRTAFRIVAIAALVVLVACLAWFIPAKMGAFATDRQAMVARYASPPSRFVTVDGVPMHVRIEGQGPPVLMLHGTGVNLHEWDPLAERMRGRFTVVRMDWPPYGLSGPIDPKGYSTARAAQLVGLTLDKLGYDKLAVVATSNGSNIALQLNANKPERITAMAFSILPLERPSQTRKVDWRIKRMAAFNDAWLRDYHPRWFYRLAFKDTSHPGWQPPEFLSQMMYDMSNLPGAIGRQKQYLASNVVLFKTTDVGAIAEKVRVPVLLQWCAQDTVISQGAGASVKRFTNTHVDLIEYPNVGHWPMWEIPDRFAADIMRFLDANPAAAGTAKP
ncbi:alpha/beta fold hydrolase [Sphingomonas glacialis]|nr:alpha/beta hydrolase [Sphingomonas glacialis]